MNENVVAEHKFIKLSDLSEADIAYLQKDCFKRGSYCPYEVDELKDNCVRIKNSSYAGIIQLGDSRLYFSTKVKANLFYMLSFLRNEESFLYDAKKPIEIKEGGNFFDILGRMFLNELKDIFEKGFYKSYVRKEENIAFVKGKLVIKGQLQNDIKKRSKFFCSYEDLTYDNLENRIVLKAATLLIPLIKFNEEIKRELLRYSLMLREEVSLAGIMPDDCDKVQFSRLNENYETIIQISRAVLQNYFIRSTHHGESIGFNFIVNMNKVFEDFITAVLEELVEEKKIFGDYELEKQAAFDTLVKEREIVTKPDVILKKWDESIKSYNYPVIIDAKYKTAPANTDYYQVIAYSLALSSAKQCFLILPAPKQDYEQENMGGMTKELTLITNPARPGEREVKLYALTVDLMLDEELSFYEYISAVKKELEFKFSEVLAEPQKERVDNVQHTR